MLGELEQHAAAGAAGALAHGVAAAAVGASPGRAAAAAAATAPLSTTDEGLSRSAAGGTRSLRLLDSALKTSNVVSAVVMTTEPPPAAPPEPPPSSARLPTNRTVSPRASAASSCGCASIRLMPLESELGV